MALAVCLLFDPATDRALRQLWARLEEAGLPTLLTHTHRRHVPHLSYAVLRSYDVARVQAEVASLPDEGAVPVRFDGLGLFPRGRAWLIPTAAGLASRQRSVVAAARAAGADVHRHYEPPVWLPHCTIAPRTRPAMLPALAVAVYDMLPLQGWADRAALVDSGTGELWPLDRVP